MREALLRFGPATIRLTAEDTLAKVHDVLCRWIEPEPGGSSSGPDVCVALTGGRAPGRPDRATEWSNGESCGWWDGKAWDGLPRSESASGGRSLALHLNESPVFRATRIVPDAMIRLAHVHGFGRAEMLASAALYGHLLAAVQRALRIHDATLVHASAVASADGDAVLLLGRGGAGKTSASTQLYIRKPESWRYMSDDLALLAADGTLYRSPVPLNVFPYNTERFPELWNLIAGSMSAASRLQWRLRRRLFGTAGAARRRAPFAEYLGPPVARVRQVVELDRADIDSPSVETIDSARVASEGRDVLAHELRRGFDGMSRLREVAGPDAGAMPDPVAVLDDAERVMRSAFEGIRLHRIVLPRLAPPDEVCAVVERAIGVG